MSLWRMVTAWECGPPEAGHQCHQCWSPPTPCKVRALRCTRSVRRQRPLLARSLEPSRRSLYLEDLICRDPTSPFGLRQTCCRCRSASRICDWTHRHDITSFQDTCNSFFFSIRKSIFSQAWINPITFFPPPVTLKTPKRKNQHYNDTVTS